MLRLLSLAVALYSSTLCLSGCVDWALLFPSTRRYVVRRSVQRRTIPFEGGVVEAFIWRARGGRAARVYLLEFTGNAERAESGSSFLPHLWPVAVEVWRINYPGFGRSSGPYGLRRIAGAARAAFDALSARAAGKPIIVAGNSMGCTAALHLAARRRPAAVIVKSVPPLRELLLRRYGFLFALPFALQIPLSLDAPLNARRSRGAPALFFTAERDWLVPPHFQREVFADYRGPKRQVMLPNAGHNTRLYGYLRQTERALRWLLAQAQITAR